MSFSVFEYNLKHPITDKSIEYQRERMGLQSPQRGGNETERLREALRLILNANSLPYAQEIASKALSEQDASPCPTNTIK
jgi:hypothetical protein